jgi:hypothetical protein
VASKFSGSGTRQEFRSAPRIVESLDDFRYDHSLIHRRLDALGFHGLDGNKAKNDPTQQLLGKVGFTGNRIMIFQCQPRMIGANMVRERTS